MEGRSDIYLELRFLSVIIIEFFLCSLFAKKNKDFYALAENSVTLLLLSPKSSCGMYVDIKLQVFEITQK